MRKRNYIFLSLLPLLVLSGCNSENNNESIVSRNISSLRQGFNLDGQITQTRIELNNTSLEPLPGASEETNIYNTNFIFQNNNGLIGYSKESSQLMGGIELGMEDYEYYCDDEGFAYNKELNYKNEVVDTYPLSFNRKVPYYANGFYNPFLILNENDFTLSTTNSARYDLNLEKTSILANNLLYSLNSGFFGQVQESYVLLSGDDFSIFTIHMSPRIMTEFDNDTYTTKYFEVENVVNFSISNIGTAKLNEVTPIESKNNIELQSALDKITNNFTLTVSDSSLTETSDYYYDGSTIYVHEYRETDSPEVNFETDFYLAEDSENPNGYLYGYSYDAENQSFVQNTEIVGFPQAYQGVYFYNDYLPIISGISADLFTYDSENNLYVGDESAINALVNCFIPNLRPFYYEHAANASKVAIRLNDNNEIDYVTFTYGYMDEFSGEIFNGEVRATYKDVGVTENPAL